MTEISRASVAHPGRCPLVILGDGGTASHPRRLFLNVITVSYVGWGPAGLSLDGSRPGGPSPFIPLGDRGMTCLFPTGFPRTSPPRLDRGWFAGPPEEICSKKSRNRPRSSFRNLLTLPGSQGAPRRIIREPAIRYTSQMEERSRIGVTQRVFSSVGWQRCIGLLRRRERNSVTVQVTGMLRMAEIHDGLADLFEKSDESRIKVCQTFACESSYRVTVRRSV